MADIKNPITIVKGGGEPTLITKSITANGTYNASADNADGYSAVNVNVASENKLQKVLAKQAVTLTADDFSGCTNIIANQFQYMTELRGTFALPDSITSIGNYAFQNCSSLALTSLPAGLTGIASYAFDGCSLLTLTSLPAGLTYIAAGAFQNCSLLALTSLPTGITSIGNSAFRSCSLLALTSLPEGITSIAASAFDGCSLLTLTSLPEGITSIDAFAFRDCSGLTSLIFEGTPNFISPHTFSRCDNLTQIRVPWSEGEVANAPWGATNATITYNYVGE